MRATVRIIDVTDVAPGPQPTYRLVPDASGTQMIMTWQPFTDHPEKDFVIASYRNPDEAAKQMGEMQEHDSAHVQTGTRCLWRDHILSPR